jgi:hypothetical protein
MVAWMETNKTRMWELMMARSSAPEAPFDAVFDRLMESHLPLAGEALAVRLGGAAEKRPHAAREVIATGIADPTALARERALVLDAAPAPRRVPSRRSVGRGPADTRPL